jgi:hypothetical protein
MQLLFVINLQDAQPLRANREHSQLSDMFNCSEPDNVKENTLVTAKYFSQPSKGTYLDNQPCTVNPVKFLFLSVTI